MLECECRVPHAAVEAMARRAAAQSRTSVTLDMGELEIDDPYGSGCDDGTCAVPGKGSHNNTIRTLELSLQAAGTDG